MNKLLSGRACPECDALMEWVAKKSSRKISIIPGIFSISPNASETCPSCDYEMPINLHIYSNNVAEGNILRMQGRYIESEKCLLEVYEYSQTLDIDHCLGLLYSDMGDLNKSLEFYQKGEEHFNSWPSDDISTRQDFLIDFGHLHLIMLKNYNKAIEILEKAIKIYEKNFKGYYNLGSSYAGSKKFEDAKKCYERAIEINPSHEGSILSLKAIKDIFENNA